MRIRYWSSDVCSSDLPVRLGEHRVEDDEPVTRIGETVHEPGDHRTRPRPLTVNLQAPIVYVDDGHRRRRRRRRQRSLEKIEGLEPDHLKHAWIEQTDGDEQNREVEKQSGSAAKQVGIYRQHDTVTEHKVTGKTDPKKAE